MNKKDMIEKLKKPELAQPPGIYDEYFPEMAEIIRRAEPKNCLYWQLGNKSWRQATNLQLFLCYILKSDYDPARTSDHNFDKPADTERIIIEAGVPCPFNKKVRCERYTPECHDADYECKPADAEMEKACEIHKDAEAAKGEQLQHLISDEEFCKMNKVGPKRRPCKLERVEDRCTCGLELALKGKY